jgi:CheY-like chemotaxis protein
MPTAQPPRFADLVAAEEAPLLAEWLLQQRAAPGTRMDLMGASELEEQSRHFLRKDGIARARSARPDAIVLDLGLPDSDGFAVVEQLRGATLTRDIPVLVCTSRALDLAQRAQLAGVSAGMVAKDHLERDLARSVQAALANATTHRPETA